MGVLKHPKHPPGYATVRVYTVGILDLSCIAQYPEYDVLYIYAYTMSRKEGLL